MCTLTRRNSRVLVVAVQNDEKQYSSTIELYSELVLQYNILAGQSTRITVYSKRCWQDVLRSISFMLLFSF
jgi:hypothetical protein